MELPMVNKSQREISCDCETNQCDLCRALCGQQCVHRCVDIGDVCPRSSGQYSVTLLHRDTKHEARCRSHGNWPHPHHPQQREPSPPRQPITMASRTHRHSTAMGVLLTLSLLTLGSLTQGLQSNDIHTYLQGGQEPWADPQDGPQEVVWGIQDTTATVDKVFRYPLPRPTDVVGYKVTELGKDHLPQWLHFDNKTMVLMGVPTQNEAGQEINIEVTPVTAKGQPEVKDMFSVKVVEDTVHLDTSAVPFRDVQSEGLRPVKCPQGSSVTMASIIVDTDLSLLKPQQRVALMEGMGRHLQMPDELLRLLPMGSKPMFDSSALVAGPGDVKMPTHTGVMLQWEVGCGNVFANHMPILQQLESTSHDGSMGQAVGHGIVGWHVTNNKPHAPKRTKRRVKIIPTATLEPSHMRPPPSRIVPTSSTKIEATDGTPPSRSVPSMESPTFPEIQPTKSSHHHHHHRTKTTGRHHHSKTHGHKHSPKESKTRGVMATATVLTITPTRVVDVVPSTMEVSIGRATPSLDIPSLGVSRTESIVQPSMTATATVEVAVSTKPLPTRTYTMPDGASTDATHIQPSSTEVFTPPTKVPPMLSSTTQAVTTPSTTTTRKTTTKPPTTTTTTPEPEPEPEIPTPTRKVPPTPKATDKAEVPDTYDYPPMLKNQIPRLEVKVGDFLQYVIPADTFLDMEDGDTRGLKLMFLTVDGYNPTRSSWVRFNETTQTLYGQPLAQHAGRQEYLMIALDSNGKIGRDAFEIYVRLRPIEQRLSHEFSVTIKGQHRVFIQDVNKRLDLARKIARLYGDNDLSKMTVTRIDEGSVVYAWTNNTLPLDPCPESAILELLSHLINTNDNAPKEEMIKALHPYRIKNFEFIPKGTCEENLPPVTPKVTTTTPVDPSQVAKEKKTSEEDILITTVVPAVVIAAILLLAGIIACVLYRKKRKGKLSDEDQNTFINKGIPIIFQDEMDDKPEPPTKPLILDDEKPPLPPPGYPRSDPSTPRSDHKEPLIDSDDDMDFTDMTSPLYQPPPPMTGSLGSRGSGSRPRTNSSQRSPPPYVPP